jgi:AmiR/NasT family two-component response regulator
VVGVINLRDCEPHHYSPREISLISTVGALVGAEVELARLVGENAELLDLLDCRIIVERAKGILQRSLGISEIGANLILQEEGRKTSKALREVAASLVLADESKHRNLST